MRARLALWIPLALFAFFAGLAAYMLTQPKQQFVESTMIGQPLPAFALDPAFSGLPGAAKADFTGKPKLLNIWASWCGPCIQFSPIFQQVASELEPHFRFVKVDTEQQAAIAARYAIRSIPTMVIFKGGAEVARISGALGAADIARWVRTAV